MLFGITGRKGRAGGSKSSVKSLGLTEEWRSKPPRWRAGEGSEPRCRVKSVISRGTPVAKAASRPHLTLRRESVGANRIRYPAVHALNYGHQVWAVLILPVPKHALSAWPGSTVARLKLSGITGDPQAVEHVVQFDATLVPPGFDMSVVGNRKARLCKGS